MGNDEPIPGLGAAPADVTAGAVVDRSGAAPAVPAGLLTYGAAARISGSRTLFDFRVRHEVPAGAELIEADPLPDLGDGQLVWALGDLVPGAEARVRVTVSARPGLPPAPGDGAEFRTSYEQRVAVGGPRPAAGGLRSYQARILVPGGPTVRRFRVEHVVPAGTRFHSAEPAPSASGGQLVWDLSGAVGAAEVPLRVTVTADDPGLRPDVVAVFRVGYDFRARVKRYPLGLALDAPEAAEEGTEATLLARVTNHAARPLAGAVVSFRLLPGLLHPRGDHLQVVLGDLGPGMTAAVALPATAVGGPGSRTAEAVVATREGFRCRASATTAVTAAAPPPPPVPEPEPPAPDPNDPGDGPGHILDELMAALDLEALQAFGRPEPEALGQRRWSARASAEDQHVVFSLAGTDYAVPGATVREIGRPPQVTPVPNVPDWVLGVANVRGDVLSVVDLRAFLGLERGGHGRDSRMLVVRAREEDMATALIVDRVRGIRAVPADAVAAPTADADPRVAPYLRGVSEHGGRLLVLLDLDRLLLSAEMRQFESV